MQPTNFTRIGLGVGAIALLAVLFTFGRSSAGRTDQLASVSAGASALAADESSYDFGSISMAAGPVTRRFAVTNGGVSPVTVEKLYTSCMCTTASLTIAGEASGPFGMPGHGAVPRINRALAPGELAGVDVTFDPAAHGPSGIGRIERSVYLETVGGAPLILNIAATVTP